MTFYKTFKQILFTLCLMVAISVILPIHLSWSAETPTDEVGAVVGVVSTFYTNYLKAAKDPEVRMGFQQHPELSAVFVAKIDALLQEAASTEPGFLGYDPILMAQDFPDSMEYATPVINGDSAELIAYKIWGDSKSPLCVALAKQEGQWRITDIIDMNFQESECQCGGMTAAGDPK